MHAAIDLSDDDLECYDVRRLWFSVETAGGPASDAVEICTCQDEAYGNEVIGIHCLLGDPHQSGLGQPFRATNLPGPKYCFRVLQSSYLCIATIFGSTNIISNE